MRYDQLKVVPRKNHEDPIIFSEHEIIYGGCFIELASRLSQKLSGFGWTDDKDFLTINVLKTEFPVESIEI